MKMDKNDNSEEVFDKRLNAILDDCLTNAEDRFGKRDILYESPKIVYDINGPHFRREGNKLIIQLPSYLRANNDLAQAVFQMSHEIIHCLSPIHTKSVTVLEEGLASFFSKEFCISSGYGNFDGAPEDYESAFDFVEELLKYDEDILKKIRQIQPVISLIAVDDFLHINNSIPIELAQNLTKKFYNQN